MILSTNTVVPTLLALFILAFGESQKPAFQAEEVKIGNQIWMANNLDVDHFANGDPIPQAQDDLAWKTAHANQTPVWCYYQDDTTNAQYGKLYNWYAVHDPRGLAPKGWHIPSHEEWFELSDSLGGMKAAGHPLKSQSGWAKDGNGSNASLFGALPGGKRYHDGKFKLVGEMGQWWSSTKHFTGWAWYWSLYRKTPDLYKATGRKGEGLSVRCIKD